jgi:hypothetical protein
VLADLAALRRFEMKIYLCITVGQEINGKNAVVKVDKASLKKEDIDQYVSKSQTTWVEKIEVLGGKVDFFCERHIQEVEVENE